MKKLLSIVLAAFMVFSLVACAGETSKPTDPSIKPTDPSIAPTDPSIAPTDPTINPTDPPSEAPTKPDSSSVEKAVDGTLNLSTANLAIVINDNTVAMPYQLKDIINAGISVEDFVQEIELSAGDYFTPNIFIDEDWNYGISPNYYNESDETVSITEAKAQAIGMFTYEDTPEDQNVSILGIKFAMTKAEVISILGDPMWNDGDEFQWLVSVSDGNLEGNYTVSFVSDAEDAIVSAVNLSVHEPW